MKGSSFNANNLIENLLNDNQNDESIFSKERVKIDIEIDKVYLDKIHQLKNFLMD